jgi:hypothetical protein
MSEWNSWEWLGYITTWVGAIVIAIGGAIKAEPRLRRRLPSVLRARPWAFVPLILMLIGAVGFALGYDDKQWEPVIPVMDDYGADYGPGTPLVFVAGHPETLSGPKSVHIILEGKRLLRFAKKYRLLGVCFHSVVGDPMDSNPLSKGGLYEIRNERITLRIPWNQTFQEEVVRPLSGTNYVLLMIPKSVSAEQFNSVNQAIAVGAIVVETRAGPP